LIWRWLLSVQVKEWSEEMVCMYRLLYTRGWRSLAENILGINPSRYRLFDFGTYGQRHISTATVVLGTRDRSMSGISGMLSTRSDVAGEEVAVAKMGRVRACLHT